VIEAHEVMQLKPGCCLSGVFQVNGNRASIRLPAPSDSLRGVCPSPASSVPLYIYCFDVLTTVALDLFPVPLVGFSVCRVYTLFPTKRITRVTTAWIVMARVRPTVLTAAGGSSIPH